MRGRWCDNKHHVTPLRPLLHLFGNHVRGSPFREDRRHSYEGNGFQLTASGGVAPYQWKGVAAPAFSTPDGLGIAPTGLISGTPTTSGTFNVVITVLDAESPSAQVSQDYTITIEGSVTLAINSDAPPNGTVGVDYGPMVTEYFSCRRSPILG